MAADGRDKPSQKAADERRKGDKATEAASAPDEGSKKGGKKGGKKK